jgi:uncharacterized protein (TIGR03086 family)
MPLPLLELLDRCLDHAATVVAGIRDDQRAAPTPCPDLTVDQLLVHLVGGLKWYGQLPAGGPGDPRDVPGSQLAPLSYPDAFADVRTLIRSTWSPARLTDRYPMPGGEVTGAGMTEYMVVEVLGHTWDLAVATGQPTDPPGGVAEDALGVARGLGEEALRAPGMMGPAVPVDPDAPAIDRFAAFLGRTVS